MLFAVLNKFLPFRYFDTVLDSVSLPLPEDSTTEQNVGGDQTLHGR